MDMGGALGEQAQINGTKEFHELLRAHRDPSAHEGLLHLDEYDEEDEGEITSDTSWFSDAQSEASEAEEDSMHSDETASADGGWVIFHPYLNWRRIKILNTTMPVGNVPLHVLLEYHDKPGFENLEPFILVNIDTTAHEWTLVLETYNKRKHLEEFANVRTIYAIVRE